jgi:signal transduction histidine kinase
LHTEQYPRRFLKSFFDVALHLTQDLDIDRVLQVIVERAIELTQARYGAAATLNATGIERFVYRGLTPEQVAELPHTPVGKGLLGAVITDAQAIRTPNIEEHPESVGFPSNHVAMAAFLGVPMIAQGELVGALYLTKSPGAPEFTDEDEEVVTAMASLAAVGIINSRLFAVESDRAERAGTLNKIAWGVRHSLDVSDVLEATVEELGKALDVGRCYIRLVEERGSVRLGPMEAEWTAPGVERIAGQRDLQYPVSTLAAHTLVTQYSSDVEHDSRLRDPNLPPVTNLLERNASAVLSTPIEWADELMGVVTLHAMLPRDWTRPEIDMMEAAAREVAVALHHARIYEAAVDTANKLKELDELRSDFVSMVSHELRSPMTVVTGIAHILLWRKERLSETESDQLLETLEREARRLSRLVSEFLDMEAIDRGKITLQVADADLLELSGEAMIDAGLATRVNLVAGEGDTLMAVDRDRIKQVLLNLMSNAAKFSDEDQPITVTVDPGADAMTISVADRGPGIPDEDRGRLFERFGRLSSTVARAPGSGIGLYVSRMIVELHGGEIWVDSVPGEGATFCFSLPRAT